LSSSGRNSLFLVLSRPRRRSLPLKFRSLTGLFAICQLPATEPIPTWANGHFLSITHSDEELSIVCPQASVPAGIKADAGWVCFKLQGPFAFSQTGILTSFIGPLSANAIPIFTISTYDTDYVLVKEGFLPQALNVLRNAGHELLPSR
jgi:hypothetical protein